MERPSYPFRHLPQEGAPFVQETLEHLRLPQDADALEEREPLEDWDPSGEETYTSSSQRFRTENRKEQLLQGFYKRVVEKAFREKHFIVSHAWSEYPLRKEALARITDEERKEELLRCVGFISMDRDTEETVFFHTNSLDESGFPDADGSDEAQVSSGTIASYRVLETSFDLDTYGTYRTAIRVFLLAYLVFPFVKEQSPFLDLEPYIAIREQWDESGQGVEPDILTPEDQAWLQAPLPEGFYDVERYIRSTDEDRPPFNGEWDEAYNRSEPPLGARVYVCLNPYAWELYSRRYVMWNENLEILEEHYEDERYKI